MIKSFADKETERLFQKGQSKRFSSIARVALRKLDMLAAAEEVRDLLSPPGNRLEELKGHRQGQYSIRINNQWRLCFRFRNGNAEDVEIVDYH